MLKSENASAYELAKAGGPHHRWLLQQRKLPRVKLLKSIRSLRRQIEQHQAWIADTWLKCPADHDLDKVRYTHHRWIYR